MNSARRNWKPLSICGYLGQSIRQRLADQRANYASYLVRPVDPGLVFSGRQLIDTPHAFAQAMTLLWLAQR